MTIGIHIGTVVGETSPQDFRFILRSRAAKLGDLVSVSMDIPRGTLDNRGVATEPVTVWGRIIELVRSNPFLPLEAGQELAEEGINMLDTILSFSRDQTEARVLVLGCDSEGDARNLRPLNYPVTPGAEVILPPADTVRTILTGDENVHRLHLGHLIGRPDVAVSLKTNSIVARHMAILAMTGGGKTVATRRVIRELLDAQYPLVIFDPHGDYLGFWSKRNLFPKNNIRLFYPNVRVQDETRNLMSFLIKEMTQGLTEPQRDVFEAALEDVRVDEQGTDVMMFISRLLQKLENMKDDGQKRHGGTIPAVKRALRIVHGHLAAMQKSNERLRAQPRLKDFDFQPLPDPMSSPHELVRPGQASIIYLGGYDHITQSTVVALVLKVLFERRASMSNEIPPLLAVIEEAHNFIPSHSEGQTGTPSVEIIRKVITEGRKFGVGLLLISQRPSRLDETTLSQCNTYMIFRLVNPKDQSFVEKVMENLTKADSRLLPSFGPGQGIVSGQAVRFPLLVQVKFDGDLVTSSLGDEDFLAEAKQWSGGREAAAADRSDAMSKELDD
jgi:DNA helicase HerA-like ATPase